MAGIGFELKKLFVGEHFFGKTKAVTFSAITIVGPMVLCILLITVVKWLLAISHAPAVERQLFLAATLYCFIFSQIITGAFNMLISRYISDLLFSRRNEAVLSSLYGVLAICILIGGLTGAAFYLGSSVPILLKLSSYLFFIELIMIWLLSVYISALKNVRRIIKGFAVGVAVSLLALLGCTVALDGIQTAAEVFFCMNFGFFVVILFFFHTIQKQFPVNNQDYFRFLTYFEKFPALFFIGLFYVGGLYVHNFLVWQSSLGETIGHTFRMAAFYDVPVFYAYLTVLPATILFVVSLETSFSTANRSYYAKILGTSPLQEMVAAQTKMFQVLSQELAKIVEIQLLFTMGALFLGRTVLPLSTTQVDIFNIVTVANYFFILLVILMQVLLYFDDRKGALLVMLVYLLSCAVLTPVTSHFGKYGASCFYASFLGMVVALVRLQHFSKNIGYYTFCTQPLVAKERNLWTSRLIAKLDAWNKKVL